jgi:histidine triad (HIT) family protein
MEGCIFCKIVRGEIPCFKILEDDRVLSFADVNPINTGHTLIIPKRHAENIWDIDGEDLAAPRKSSDPKLTMTEWEMVPGDMAAIGKTAEKIAAAIK